MQATDACTPLGLFFGLLDSFDGEFHEQEDGDGKAGSNETEDDVVDDEGSDYYCYGDDHENGEHDECYIGIGGVDVKLLGGSVDVPANGAGVAHLLLLGRFLCGACISIIA